MCGMGPGVPGGAVVKSGAVGPGTGSGVLIVLVLEKSIFSHYCPTNDELNY